MTLPLLVAGNPLKRINRKENRFTYKIASNSTDTLRIWNKGKLLKEEYFVSKPVPNPVAFIYKSDKNKLGLSQIEASPYVNCWPFEYNLKRHFEVVSFDLTIKDPNGNLLIAESLNIGSKINEENMMFIRQTKKGAILYFENIKATGPNNTVRRLKGVVIEII